MPDRRDAHLDGRQAVWVDFDQGYDACSLVQRSIMSRFSPTLMDHFQSPRNAVDLEDAHFVGQAGAPDSPPYMLIKLKMDGNIVVGVSFRTFGCGVSIACGSALSELVDGKTLADCRNIRTADVIAAVDGVPEDKTWCADVSVKALEDALAKSEIPLV